MKDAELNVIASLDVAGGLLPEADELRDYVRASERDETLAPILHPGAWSRASGRLEAGKRLAAKAAEFKEAWEAFRQVAEREADPELDAAAREVYRAERQRIRGSRVSREADDEGGA